MNQNVIIYILAILYSGCGLVAFSLGLFITIREFRKNKDKDKDKKYKIKNCKNSEMGVAPFGVIYNTILSNSLS